jgi:hypothetical protein
LDSAPLPQPIFFYSNFFNLAIFVGKTIVQNLGKTKQQTICQQIGIKNLKKQMLPLTPIFFKNNSNKSNFKHINNSSIKYI